MEKPDWARVLDDIYESGGRVCIVTGGLSSESENIHQAKELIEDRDSELDVNIPDKRGHEAIGLLEKVGLIEEMTKSDLNEDEVSPVVSHSLVGVYNLTQEGFNVAHERSVKEREHSINLVIAVFTALLGITALIQSIPILAQLKGKLGLVLIGLLGLSIGFVFSLAGRELIDL